MSTTIEEEESSCEDLDGDGFGRVLWQGECLRVPRTFAFYSALLELKRFISILLYSSEMM